MLYLITCVIYGNVFMGMNLYLFFLFRTLGAPFLWLYSAGNQSRHSLKTLLGRSPGGVRTAQHLGQFLGLGERIAIRKRGLKRYWEVQIAPPTSPPWEEFSLPLLLPLWYIFIKTLRIVAGPLMSSGKDFCISLSFSSSLTFFPSLTARDKVSACYFVW